MILRLTPLFYLFLYGEAYKYLVVFPFPVRSMNILGEGHVRHLLKAGHEVTFATVFPIQENLGKNLRQIDISGNLEIFEDEEHFTIKYIMETQVLPDDIYMLYDYSLSVAEKTFTNKNFLKLLEDPNERFDAVIADYYEVEIYAGLAALYNCPMIWSWSMEADFSTLKLIDEHTNPAYTADYMSLNTHPFSFSQRVSELWTQIVRTIKKSLFLTQKAEESYKLYFESLFSKRGKPLPAYEDLVYNASLILSNAHQAIGNHPKTPQNFKMVGGYHVETPPKPLPKDLQDLMDKDKHGVIYFSMGSTWRSKDIPQTITEGLLKVFGELKQTVIWKYEEDLLNLPKNIHILKWAPQTSILAHPNCRFFITHGGFLSSIEAVHYGMPIIGIPVSFDQFVNINKAVNHGYAIRLDLSYDLHLKIKPIIQTLLSENKYRQRAKQMSEIYHDRPTPPGKEVVHWAEHVVKTKGAPHLRSPALMVPWYQKMYLDLFATILVGLGFVVLVMMKMLTMKQETKSKKRN